ncbi:MAG TPA: MucR family transcriptional regulator, partial [Caulobacter sp.]|nr:MucR family transcriptional regulator [Caulobacter sp.]
MTAQNGDADINGGKSPDLLALSADIVAAYVGQNTVSQSVIPELIRTVHGALSTLNGAEEPRIAEKAKPAVPVSRSIQHDYIV